MALCEKFLETNKYIVTLAKTWHGFEWMKGGERDFSPQVEPKKN